MPEKTTLPGQQKLYWTLLLILGLSLESVALIYQYLLGEWPFIAQSVNAIRQLLLDSKINSGSMNATCFSQLRR